jgi:tetratricopeptide (TPR) repeat protein
LADSARLLTESGFLNNRIATLDSSIALLDHARSVSADDGIALYERGYALYRRANLLSLSQRRDDAKRALDAADKALEESARVLPWAETLALRAAVVGQKIGFSSNPLTAMRLGPRSNNLMDKAIAIAPNNPRVILIRGIGSLYKPRLLGGGADKAEKDLLRATVLFSNDHPAAPLPSWGHAESFAFLGLVYAQTDRVTEARAAYARALEISPGFDWVQRVLLPSLDQKRR